MNADKLISEARAMGEEHGKSAGTWYFSGNDELETYQRVLNGLNDGDPAILDTLPCSPLSGEWADDPTPASVFEDLGMSGDEDFADDVLNAYEDGFTEASQAEVERAALAQVSA